MPNDIDLMVGMYSPTEDIEGQALSFLSSLHGMCDLDEVNVFVVERLHNPISAKVKDTAALMGFKLRKCLLPPAESSREDTSRFADWMAGLGTAPWFIVSHFDVAFTGDYIQYVRDNMGTSDMMGNHHDGIMAVRRGAYNQCQVGFCGVGNIHLMNYGHDVRVMPADYPGANNHRPILSLDVGELLALRMCTLGMRHTLMSQFNRDGLVIGEGISNLFRHTRCGSGHDLCEASADH